MSAWTVIGHVEVGAGGQAEIAFSSIPATYTDLCLMASTRAETGTSDVSVLKLNGVITNQTFRFLEGSGSTASSGSGTRIEQIDNDSGYTANTFANVMIYIPNYAGNTNKSVSSDSVGENNATLAYQWIAAGLWSQTTAINAVAIYPTSGDFNQYSSATLYGITKGSSGGVTVS